MSDLEKFRIRWKRWLGQKCRKDKPYWTTLLNSNWIGWAEGVVDLEKCHVSVLCFGPDSRDGIKTLFGEAIEMASMKDLLRLDNLYCTEKMGL